jgi:hypothetical protein
VKSNVPVAEAINDEGVLPERVQESLGQLIGAAREGLLALPAGDQIPAPASPRRTPASLTSPRAVHARRPR